MTRRADLPSPIQDLALEGLTLQDVQPVAFPAPPDAEALIALDLPDAQEVPPGITLDVPPRPEDMVHRIQPALRNMIPATLEAMDRDGGPTPMTLLSMAMDQGADPDRLERLMAMHERWEERNALKAYNRAFALFKSEAVQILRTTLRTSGPMEGTRYADLFACVDAATPALSKYGLSASWKITKDEKDWLEVTCLLRHELGHFEVVSMGGPPDVGGAKNAVQARASTVAYLERYTFLAITGLASRDSDKDGATVPTGTVAEDCIYLAKSLTLGDLHGRFKEVYPKAAKDKAAQAALMKAKDDRKMELSQPSGGGK